MMIYGRAGSAEFLENWMRTKHDIVLVTGRSSYERSGAAELLSSCLIGKNIIHLRTIGADAQVGDVEDKMRQLPRKIDAFIAVGGGTVLDTAKLLRNGFPSEVHEGVPYLAIPTTAGTGAETTRFAVYFDHGVKMSADDIRYLPTEALLIPEFAESQTPYQRAATEFDAYAQAVESLWAKRATDESRSYANKALELMASGQQMLGAYWAGRAIDISRTTAAHAFSYYMTATYGIPHGHAVYMMFPYICKNNGRPEFIKEVPGLKSLKEFAAEKNISWNLLVDELFARVNLQRLGNNPVPVRRESFYE